MDDKQVVGRKDYQCTLCFQTIPKGEKHQYARITPWDHINNVGFSDFRAHLECAQEWDRVGQESDWEFPNSKDEFIRPEKGGE